MAWICQAHFRWFDAQGFDEAQGSHCEPQEARIGQEGVQEPREGWIQAQEGYIQAFQIRFEKRQRQVI